MKQRKNVVDSTTNRKVFNRAYKCYLEKQGKLHCSWCKYHNGENYDKKWYGGHYNEKKNEYNIRYPNWKLVSKNRKQWMKKPMFIEEEKFSRFNVKYVDIKFKRNAYQY